MKNRELKIQLVSLIFLLISASSVPAQLNDADKLRELNEKIKNSMIANAFAAAEEFSKEMIELSNKIYGPASRDSAIGSMNLGYAQKQQKKLEPAIQNFQTAVNILKGLDSSNRSDLIKAYEALAHTYFIDGKKKIAISSYLDAIATAEKEFGLESKQGYSPTLNLANVLLLEKDYERANEYYVKAYGLALRYFGTEAVETEKIEDTRMCSAIPTKVSKEQNTMFFEVRKKFILSQGPSAGVLNGKLISLPRPIYPPEAKSARLSGLVVLRVKINEDGTVGDMRTVCGHPILATSAKIAAKGARFQQTILNGKPVAVNGVISYSFNP